MEYERIPGIPGENLDVLLSVLKSDPEKIKIRFISCTEHGFPSSGGGVTVHIFYDLVKISAE